jgi:hypothetical protein
MNAPAGSTSASGEHDRYPFMHVLALVYKILAAVELVAAIVLFILLSMESAPLGAFGVLIGGIVLFVILLGTSEAIGVFIGIEENTRELKEIAADLLERKK